MSRFDFQSLDVKLAGFEQKHLNWWGKVPVASFVSGQIRSGYGAMMALAACVDIVFKAIKSLFVGAQQRKQLFRDMGREISYIGQGFGNIFRGQVETVFLLGNLLAYCWDNVFKARVAFPGEGSPLDPRVTTWIL